MSEREPTAGPDTEPSALLAERRAFVRMASDLAVTCQQSSRTLEAGWPGTVVNISCGGLGLLLRHRFRPGTDLSIDMRGHEDKPERILNVRVMHATAVLVDGSPLWLLGCAFSEPLTADEWRALR